MPGFLKDLNAISRGTTLFREERLRQYGLGGSQVKYILAVCSGGGVSQDELARKLLVNKSNVARQVVALEAAGFVRREQSLEDKRVWKVWPTRKAEELVPVIRAINEEWRAVICRGLTEEESGQLASLLSRIVSNVRAEEEGKK